MDKKYEVIPGTGIGDVELGMSTQQVNEVLGLPNRIGQDDTFEDELETIYNYYEPKMSCYFYSSENNELGTIVFRSTLFHYEGESIIGMEPKAAMDLLGGSWTTDDDGSFYTHQNEEGVTIIEEDGLVHEIELARP